MALYSLIVLMFRKETTHSRMGSYTQHQVPANIPASQHGSVDVHHFCVLFPFFISYWSLVFT